MELNSALYTGYNCHLQKAIEMVYVRCACVSHLRAYAQSFKWTISASTSNGLSLRFTLDSQCSLLPTAFCFMSISALPESCLKKEFLCLGKFYSRHLKEASFFG